MRSVVSMARHKTVVKRQVKTKPAAIHILRMWRSIPVLPGDTSGLHETYGSVLSACLHHIEPRVEISPPPPLLDVAELTAAIGRWTRVVRSCRSPMNVNDHGRALTVGLLSAASRCYPGLQMPPCDTDATVGCRCHRGVQVPQWTMILWMPPFKYNMVVGVQMPPYLCAIWVHRCHC